MIPAFSASSKPNILKQSRLAIPSVSLGKAGALPKTHLYAYSDGSIQVGKGNALTQLILGKPEEDGFWVMKIRENGIY